TARRTVGGHEAAVAGHPDRPIVRHAEGDRHARGAGKTDSLDAQRWAIDDLLIRAIGRVIPSMRLPCARFTVPRMMIAVAPAGTALGLVECRSRALALADYHLSQVVLEGWACSRNSCQRFYVAQILLASFPAGCRPGARPGQ